MTLWVVTADSGLGGHWVVGVFTSKALAEAARDNDIHNMDHGPTPGRPTGYCGHCITEVLNDTATTGTQRGGCG